MLTHFLTLPYLFSWIAQEVSLTASSVQLGFNPLIPIKRRDCEVEIFHTLYRVLYKNNVFAARNPEQDISKRSPRCHRMNILTTVHYLLTIQRTGICHTEEQPKMHTKETVRQAEILFLYSPRPHPLTLFSKERCGLVPRR